MKKGFAIFLVALSVYLLSFNAFGATRHFSTHFNEHPIVTPLEYLMDPFPFGTKTAICVEALKFKSPEMNEKTLAFDLAAELAGEANLQDVKQYFNKRSLENFNSGAIWHPTDFAYAFRYSGKNEIKRFISRLLRFSLYTSKTRQENFPQRTNEFRGMLGRISAGFHLIFLLGATSFIIDGSYSFETLLSALQSVPSKRLEVGLWIAVGALATFPMGFDQVFFDINERFRKSKSAWRFLEKGFSHGFEKGASLRISGKIVVSEDYSDWSTDTLNRSFRATSILENEPLLGEGKIKRFRKKQSIEEYYDLPTITGFRQLIVDMYYRETEDKPEFVVWVRAPGEMFEEIKSK